jgi:hypothetical protein
MRFLPFVLVFCIMCATAAVSEAKPETFTDPRDRRHYPAVQVGPQVWMARDLAFQSQRSWCYEDKPERCEANGRLYPWAVAIEDYALSVRCLKDE